MYFCMTYGFFFKNNEAMEHHQEEGHSQNVASPTDRGLCHQQAAIEVGLAVPKPTGEPCMLSKPPG